MTPEISSSLFMHTLVDTHTHTHTHFLVFVFRLHLAGEVEGAIVELKPHLPYPGTENRNLVER